VLVYLSHKMHFNKIQNRTTKHLRYIKCTKISKIWASKCLRPEFKKKRVQNIKILILINMDFESSWFFFKRFLYLKKRGLNLNHKWLSVFTSSRLCKHNHCIDWFRQITWRLQQPFQLHQTDVFAFHKTPICCHQTDG